jgi:hypothetical protein
MKRVVEDRYGLERCVLGGGVVKDVVNVDVERILVESGRLQI